MGGASSGAVTMETISGECRPAPPPSPEERRSLLDGDCHDPHAVLGAHPAGQGTVIRALRPFADTVTVLTRDGGRWELWPEGDGLFAGLVPFPPGTDYRYELQYAEETVVADDPFRYQPTLGELDLHLIGEGRHEKLWEVLGSRVRRFGRAQQSAAGPAQNSSSVEAAESPAPAASESNGSNGSKGSNGSAAASAAEAAERAAAQARLEAEFGPVTGVSFAVWAPNARGVRVIGDFNYWNGAAFPLRSLGGSGVWELFVPQVGAGERYKYEILGRDGIWRQKADPLARRTEPPPGNASVTDDSDFVWTDQDWLAKRAETDPYRSPMSVYELHLQSWRPGLDYRQLADELPAYLLELGFTHVEFLPPTEHPFGGSWGYQVSSYFAPTARLGKPDDFRALIDALHAAGIGVFIDWVPAHFPKDAWALADFDGTALYEHSDPRRGEHPDWGTLVFDYGRREVRNFLVASALFWCEQMHIDGLRVDAVASMLYLDYSREEGQWHPNAFGGRENLEAVSFLQELTATCYKRSPGVIVVAEESTAWPGVTLPTDHHVYGSALTGLGFGFKWNMGWMHDTLDYLAQDPINRRYHHDKMTFALVYAYTEKFVLAISHDEVVHGKGSLLRKMAGDRWQQLANVRAYLAFMWAHPGKQLLFSGCEFAQDAEWSEQHGLDWWLLDYPEHRGVFRTVQDLNFNYTKQPALWEQDHTPAGFEWLIVDDSDHNVFAFVRWSADGRPLVCVVNFAAVPWNDYHLPLPLSAEQSPRWIELLNTDAEQYGGSGVGNYGMVSARDEEWSGRPSNAVLRLPPLGTLWLVPERVDELVGEIEAEAEEVIAEAEQVAISAVEAPAELVVEVLPGPTAEPVGELENEAGTQSAVYAGALVGAGTELGSGMELATETGKAVDEPQVAAASVVELVVVPLAELEEEPAAESADERAEPVAQAEPVLAAAPEPEPEPVAESEPVAEVEAVAKPQPVAKAEPVTVVKVEPAAKVEPATKPETVAKPELVTKPEPLAKAEPVAKPKPSAKVEPVAKPESVATSEPVTKSKPVAKPEPAPAPAGPAATTAPKAAAQPATARTAEPTVAPAPAPATAQPKADTDKKPSAPKPSATTASALPSARRDTMMPLFRTPTNRSTPQPAPLPAQVAPAETRPFRAPKPPTPAPPRSAPRTVDGMAGPIGPATTAATFSAAPPAPTPAPAPVRPKPAAPLAQRPRPRS
ncbi:MAG TPA: 1,4-alpha-glucan branching protein GlgB [Actinocrinis sp.]|nr:1,4-alpha-glucan branching protein GlgB [Actinocrinis sp.]